MMATPTSDGIHFLALPVEILSALCSFLSNKDMKNLRLTSRLLSSICKLRIDRVFLSASPRNIAVFRSIAQHETFRRQIVEIIWDDALLQPLPSGGTRYQFDVAPIPWIPPWADCWDYETFYDNSMDTCPLHFWQQCEKNLHYLEVRKYRDIADRPKNLACEEMIAARLPLLDSLDYYEELLREQDEVLSSSDDIEAFRYGLERFSALRKVTITPCAHGVLFTPLCETPMIRSFP